MTTQMHRLETAGGHIAYARAGAGAPPVVLLHAGYVDHRMYQREIAHLSRRTTVLAPDARTHGESVAATTPFRHCDDVAALVRGLGAPAVLVGTSMGAGTAVDTVLEHPDVVLALVVSGAGTNEPEFEDPQVLELLARQHEAIARQDVAGWLAATIEFVAGPFRTLDHVDAGVVGRIRQLHEHFVTRVGPDVVPPTVVPGSWDRLGEITVPVLGIVGDLDYPDHLRMTERLVDAVPDGRGLLTVPGAGHYPNLEQPQAWERAVDAFLAEAVHSQGSAAPRVGWLP